MKIPTPCLLAGLVLAALVARADVPAGFVESYYADYNAQNLDRLAAYYREDCELIDPTFDLHYKSRQEIFDAMKMAMPAYAGFNWRVDRRIEQGDAVAVQGFVSGKFRGRPFGMNFVTVFEFREGRIARHFDYMDAVDFGAAVGQMPQPLRPLMQQRVEAAVDKARMEASTPPAVAPAPAAGQPVEARQFDFWIGEWNVFAHGTTQKIGENKIYPAQGGRVLVENWTDTRGGSGMSINAWDASAGHWQQTWMGKGGNVTNFYGGLADGKMVLIARGKDAKGQPQLTRGTWTPQPDGSVRQQFENSSDNGKTWASSFDGDYRRK